MKTRYKILLFNLVITLLYFVFVWLMINSESDSNSVESTIETIINVIAGFYFMIQYIWVNVLWVFFILYGLIKKKKEYTIGGIYSVIFSSSLLLLLTNL